MGFKIVSLLSVFLVSSAPYLALTEFLKRQFFAYISERFRKNIAASFSPGFRRSLNPGSAGALKARGASVKARLGTWPRAWPICWWRFGGPAVKGRGRGGCLVLTPFAWQTLSV